MNDSISTPAPSAAPSVKDASEIRPVAICTHSRAGDTLECLDRLIPQFASVEVDVGRRGQTCLATSVLSFGSLKGWPHNEWKLRLWFDPGVIVDGLSFGRGGQCR